ncbi:MAG: FAD-binding oxidoreductase [Actinomycetota bacterium]|nr:FAD-binding oxidoreductase [Actinomycetota bacterium]
MSSWRAPTHVGGPRPTVAADAEVPLSGWGNTGVSWATVRRPARVEEVAELLSKRRGQLIARGLGRSFGDAALNAGGEVVDMTGLTGIEALDLTHGHATVQAGLSLDALLRFLVPLGWILPVTPGTRFVTVGGAIANDVHGKNHFARGSFCDHVRSFELLTPSRGVVIVDRRNDPDLFRATSGGLGLTGFILRATLELVRVETTWMAAEVQRAQDLDHLFDVMAADGVAYDHAVGWVDGTARGANLGRAVVTLARPATVDDIPTRERASARSLPTERSWNRLIGSTSGPLFRRAVPAMNELRFRRAPQHRQSRLVRLSSVLYPLDAIPGWNRLFGRSGLVQYQFVVPSGGEHAVRSVLETLATHGPPSFLTTLKRFREGRSLLSFPIAGWCLAVDVPAGHPGLGRTLDRFDELVAEAGGRVYLAKDSRLRRDAFEAMYPDVAQWRSICDSVDPGQTMASDLARRLGLKG